jgi:hypothetical protein
MAEFDTHTEFCLNCSLETLEKLDPEISRTRRAIIIRIRLRRRFAGAQHQGLRMFSPLNSPKLDRCSTWQLNKPGKANDRRTSETAERSLHVSFLGDALFLAYI